MEKYGFFGGSFNPVTKAHIELAQEILKKCNLKKVIFVPVGNHYKKEDLIDEKHRYNMLKIATRKYANLEVSSIELNQNKDLSTLEAFQKIEQEYQNIDKTYIIGADNLRKIVTSQDCELLIPNYQYIIIQRDTIDCKKEMDTNPMLQKNKTNFQILENQRHKATSASQIRKQLVQGNNYDLLLDKDVLEYIQKNKLYDT